MLDESRMRLDYVLALKIEDFLERRLQTQVFKSGLAKSIHHARVLIRQRHIRYVACPSFSDYSYSKFSELASKSSMFRPLSSASILRSILTLHLHPPMVVVALVVSSVSVPLLLPRKRRVATMRTKSKI